jgi:MOSC domain-containing protein YiiM
MTLESSQFGTMRASSRGTPEIVAIHLCPGPSSRSEMRSVAHATALEGFGLEGDRHARAGSHRQILFVEIEVLEALVLAPGVIREQVTVRGVRLEELSPGARFRAGTALLEVEDLCEPCERMNEIRPGLLEVLGTRRGRFMRVVRGGAFAVGDALVADPAASNAGRGE